MTSSSWIPSVAAAPWLFLGVSAIGALATLSALVPGRRLRWLVVPYFFSAWLTGELAIHHVAWQAVATLVFVRLGALDAWPGWAGLALSGASWTGLVVLQRRATGAPAVLEQALRTGLGNDYRDFLPPALAVAGLGAPPPRRSGAHAGVGATRAGGNRSAATAPRPARPRPEGAPIRRLVRPFHMRDPHVERLRDIPYGDAGKRHRLDVYRPASHPERCPILLQIHGGGWVIGQKQQQGQPLMHLLAARGWVCVAPNYRLSPKATFPDHLLDVKRALAWVRRHGAAYGADPDFVVVTGGSAGGHLASLLALTANEPALQPGFEDVDTSVAACVPFYGVYDFLDRHGVRGEAMAMMPFLERLVMKCSPADARERWERASPIALVRPDAPPFFVVHGTHDSLAFVEDTRHFVAALRAVSRSPVVYAELPGAQHAFDVFHSLRCAYAVDAVWRFVEWVYARHRRRAAGTAEAVAGR
jgi:acetyl esterase/lipase